MMATIANIARKRHSTMAHLQSVFGFTPKVRTGVRFPVGTCLSKAMCRHRLVSAHAAPIGVDDMDEGNESTEGRAPAKRHAAFGMLAGKRPAVSPELEKESWAEAVEARARRDEQSGDGGAGATFRVAP